MAVPADIRAVPRPKNTIVDDSGREGPKRYAVRERSSTKYVAGGNPQPRNGKVIGHIIDHEYVPADTASKDAPSIPDMLSYGSSALVRSVTRDIEKDLLAVYDPSDVFAIMSVATLRVIKPSVTANRLSTHYNRCFVCKDYPGAAISRNSIGKLFQKIGMDGTKRKLFYQRRMAATAADHHIAIDGTLKQDTSVVNDLSAYSYKARVRGCNDVSVIYAYDIERMEPICLEGIDAHVVYQKKQIKGGRFLYAFKDARKAAKEEATYLANARRKNTFSPEKYAAKKDLFGVIVLESNQDLEPKVAYTCYEDRWLLELVFKRYKSDECLDHTGEQGDFSVIGSEFVNFISTVATCRIIKKAEQAGLLDHMSYGDLMDDLSSAWRRTDAPADPATDDEYWVHTLKTVFEELEALGLSRPVPKPEPKRRGRKPKPKDQVELKPKRPRGRPRKDANQSAGDVQSGRLGNL